MLTCGQCRLHCIVAAAAEDFSRPDPTACPPFHFIYTIGVLAVAQVHDNDLSVRVTPAAAAGAGACGRDAQPRHRLQRPHLLSAHERVHQGVPWSLGGQ